MRLRQGGDEVKKNRKLGHVALNFASVAQERPQRRQRLHCETTVTCPCHGKHATIPGLLMLITRLQHYAQCELLPRGTDAVGPDSSREAHQFAR